jgi:hypothetical protein
MPRTDRVVPGLAARVLPLVLLAAVLLVAAVLGGCAGHPVKPGPRDQAYPYPYRPWPVDKQLDRLCAIPDATPANADSMEQRSMRLARGMFVDAAILHYGVSRVEHYSDNPEADAVSLVKSAEHAAGALAEGWQRRADPDLYELAKADILRTAAAMAARALEPTRAELRSYFLNPSNLKAAGDLLTGALEVAVYAQAYENDCNRLMHGVAEAGPGKRMEATLAVAALYARQMDASCERAAELGGVAGVSCKEVADLEGLFKADGAGNPP